MFFSPSTILYYILHIDITSPSELQQYGVSQSLLQRAFLQCTKEQTDLCWTLDKPVTIGFYRELHKYLQKWPTSHLATKTTVGKFYLLDDANFRSRLSCCPDNIYMFVQRIAASSKLDSEPMSYGHGVEKVCSWLFQVIKLILKRGLKKCLSSKKSWLK